MTQIEILVGLAAVVVIILLALLLKSKTERDAETGGRLTMYQPAPPTASAEDAPPAQVPHAARSVIPKFSLRVNVNVRTSIAAPSKEIADAIAERERQKGMEVEVIAPTGVAGPDGKIDDTWKVNGKSPGSA